MSDVPLLRAVPATAAHYGFGEGLRFDERTGSLLWVDLLAGRLQRAPLGALDDVEVLCDLGEPLGAFAKGSISADDEVGDVDDEATTDAERERQANGLCA